MGTSELGEVRTSAGVGWMWTATPKSVVKSRGGRVTATTALESVTRTTRQDWPANRMRSPARRRNRVSVMGTLRRGEQWRLRGRGDALGFVSLGALAGDALTVRRGVLNQIERVGCKAEFVLRN